VKNGKVEALTHDSDFGFGIRVLFRGAWGFASSSKVAKTEMETVFRKALKIAKASSKARGENLFFSSVTPVVDRYQTPISVNPFDVSTEAKLELLFKADEILRRNKKVRISESFMGSYKTEKTFASTRDAISNRRLWSAVPASQRPPLKEERFKSDLIPTPSEETLPPRVLSGFNSWPFQITHKGWLKRPNNFFQQKPVLQR